MGNDDGSNQALGGLFHGLHAATGHLIERSRLPHSFSAPSAPDTVPTARVELRRRLTAACPKDWR